MPSLIAAYRSIRCNHTHLSSLSILSSLRYRMSSNSMKCQVLGYDDQGLHKAAQLLRDGHNVAFPTETVYGLGGNALNVESVLNIFKYKGRPLTDPLIVHVPDSTSAKELLVLPTSKSQLIFDVLSSNFWPGPLTIVAKAVESIPDKVTASTGFVGVRVPSNSIARKLLEFAKIPIAAPSANRFGHVSPTRADHVIKDLGMHPIAVVQSEHDNVEESKDVCESSTCFVGIESTVLKIYVPETESTYAGGRRAEGDVEKIVIFRRGGVPISSIRDCLNRNGLVDVEMEIIQSKVVEKSHSLGIDAPSEVASSAKSGDSIVSTDVAVGLQAPGMLLTHYAPDIMTFMISSVPVVKEGYDIVSDSSESLESISTLSSLPLNQVILIDFHGLAHGLRTRFADTRDLAPSGSVEDGQREVFAALRWAEELAESSSTEGLNKIKAVFVMDPMLSLSGSESNPDAASALRDRLFRAASGKLIKLE